MPIESRRTRLGSRPPDAVRRPLAAALLLAAACGERSPDAAPAADAGAPSATAPADLRNLDSVARIQRAESLAVARDAWNLGAVIGRLEDAGLYVRDAEREVRAAGFGVPGAALEVSGSELAVFLYPSAAARLAATSRLDSAKAAPPDERGPWSGRPMLITSGNLAAVLVTTRTATAERVRNVLTARHFSSP